MENSSEETGLAGNQNMPAQIRRVRKQAIRLIIDSVILKHQFSGVHMHYNSTPRNYQSHSIQKPGYSGHCGQFDRDLLPMPSEVLDQLGITKRKLNRAGYWVIKCPVHKGGKEKNPSLHLHAKDGNFRCQSCGVKGGDILDFYRLVTGKGFAESVTDLNAWRSS